MKIKKMRWLVLIVFSLIAYRNSGQEISEVRFQGLKIFVTDLDEAKGFYQGILGFKVISNSKDQIEMESNAWPIFLEIVKDRAISGYPKHARTGLSFQTHKLLPQINNFQKLGVTLYDSLLSRNGVGISIPFEDPFGNVLNIIEVQIQEVPRFNSLRVYNSGVTIKDMDAAVEFYERILGFEEWSRDYLPEALPLKHSDGSFAFMLHYEEGLKKNLTVYEGNSQIVFMMQTSDPEKLKTVFNKKKIPYEVKGRKIICQDPEGNYIEIHG